MIVCLFALMIVLLVYCVLSIVVILINIILVMCDVDYYYYCIRFILPPCILNLTSFTACVLSLQACSEGVVNNLPRNSAGVF